MTRRRNKPQTFQKKWLSKDIMKFFNKFGPEKLEWISGIRLNVCFKDQFSAQRALLSLSNLLKVH